MYYLSQLPKVKSTACMISEPVVFDSEDEIIQVALAILANRCKKQPLKVLSPADMGNFLTLSLAEEEREVFGVVLLDNQNVLIDIVPLFFGSISSASIYPREVLKLVLERNASAIMVYHNHPSGILEPSQADLTITTKLETACGHIDVQVLDHIIVSSQGYVSLKQIGKM